MMQLWFSPSGNFVTAQQSKSAHPKVGDVAAWVSLVCLLLVPGCERKSAGTAAPAGLTVQVVAVEARRQPVTESLALVGTIAANEMVEIKCETEGIVEEINFKEGQLVKKSELLLRLDESKFAAVVAEAEANYKLSRANYERSQQLFRDKLISQQEFEQMSSTFQVNQASLELKKRQLKDARIYSPFAGTVGARNVSPGQVITRNSTLTWLVDLDPVKVEINVPERFLSQVRVGQAIEIGVAAFPGEKFKGEVYFIAPQVDSVMRTTLVKSRVANADLRLKPGMFASMELTLTIRNLAVVIPEVALIMNGDNASIFVVDTEQTAQPRKVKVGVRLAGKVEILNGLDAGEKVIVEGVQKVRPGGKVKLAPREAAAPYQQTESSSGEVKR